MKICPVRAASFRAYRQTDRRKERWTDMMKLIVAFHNFANAPKNWD